MFDSGMLIPPSNLCGSFHSLPNNSARRFDELSCYLGRGLEVALQYVQCIHNFKEIFFKKNS